MSDGSFDPGAIEQRPRGAFAAPVGEAALAQIVTRDGVEAGVAGGVVENQRSIKAFRRPARAQVLAEGIGAERRKVGRVHPVASEVDGCVQRVAAIGEAPEVAFLRQLEHRLADKDCAHQRQAGLAAPGMA